MSPADALGDQTELDAYVASLISRPLTSLEERVREAHGAFPTEVVAICRRGGVPAERAPVRNDLRLSAATSALPLPHPLDFEWRFSSAGCDELLSRFRAAARTDERLGLFGTPGLAEHVAAADGVRSEFTLYEARSEACEPLRRLLDVRLGDVGEQVRGQERRYAAVVADPPWYPAVTQRFLRAAARLLSDGGVLMLCVPGLGTRPGLPKERAELSTWAFENNLLQESIEAGVVEYEAPPFELSALAAAGLGAYDPFWRRGDLVTFRRLPGEVREVAEPVTTCFPLNDWQEATVGRTRIRVDTLAQQPGRFRVESLVPGDVLDSVSSRDPRRSGANVWTTSNRLLRVSQPLALLAAIEACNAGDANEGAVHRHAQRLLAAETEFLQQSGLE